MNRFSRTSITVIASLSVALLGASAAFASGPGLGQGNGNGSTGRGQITLDCEGATYTVAVPNPEGANGAGQIVGALGHGIPVSGTFTLTDTTAGITLDTELFGNPGHPNQQTTECTGLAFAGTAGDIFGTQLPPGVSAGDTVEGSIDAFVILKLPGQ